MVSSSL